MITQWLGQAGVIAEFDTRKADLPRRASDLGWTTFVNAVANGEYPTP